jgi:hypothetical protein
MLRIGWFVRLRARWGTRSPAWCPSRGTGYLVALVSCCGLLAASPARAFVYWSGVGIGRANLDGTAVTPGFGQGGGCGLAVDHAHIYWVDLGPNSIRVDDLEGFLVNSALVSVPSYACAYGGIATDGSHVYWANENQPTFDTIGRANVDGTGVNQSFVLGATNPCGVAVDSAHIYWATGNSGRGPGTTIGRANLDGTGVNENFITSLPGPCGVAVDATHIYWGNQNTNTIGRANLDGTQVNESFITGAGLPCAVAVDAGHIYWMSNPFGPTNSIGRANLDGTGVNPAFIATANAACGVAVDALQPATATITSSPSSIVYGQDLALTATVTGDNATPTGTVQFKVDGVDDGLPVMLDGSGHAGFAPSYLVDVGSTVTARYSGDSAYGPTRANVQPIVTPADTATALSSSANPQTIGSDVTFIATVSNLSTDITPFGSVQFLIDGDPALDPQPLDDNGQAGIIVSEFDPGDHVVQALYHDDTGLRPDFTDSQAGVTQRIDSPPGSSPPPVSPSPPSAVSPPPAVAPIAISPPTAKVTVGGTARTILNGNTIRVDTGERIACPPGRSRCSADVTAQTQTTAAAASALHIENARKRAPITIGHNKLTISAGRRAKVFFSLNRRGAALLRRTGRLTAKLTTTARVGNNTPVRVRKTITIRLPPSTKRH